MEGQCTDWFYIGSYLNQSKNKILMYVDAQESSRTTREMGE